MKRLSKILIYSLFVVLCSHLYAQEGKLIIKIKGIEEKGGMLYIGVYNSSETFLKKTYLSTKVPVNQLDIESQFAQIPFGTYAVSIFLDENDNQKLDTALFGIPTEPYGFSKNAKGFMGPPSFKSCAINLTKDTTTIEIKID